MMGLRCLDLRDNLIHAVGVSALANAFYDDEHLEVLDVSGNPITDVGGRHLAKLVKMNSYLRELEINRCGLGENTVRAMDKALYINTTLELLQAHENGLSRTKMQVLADAVQCNFELRDIWEDPVKYDLNARSPALVRLLLKKVHLLPSEQLHKLYSNKSVMANPDYEKLVVELAPPSRKHIILSGSAGMSKTLVAGEGKLKAALMIQRQWRFKKSGKKRVDFHEAVNIMIKERRRELHNRYVQRQRQHQRYSYRHCHCQRQRHYYRMRSTPPPSHPHRPSHSRLCLHSRSRSHSRPHSHYASGEQPCAQVSADRVPGARSAATQAELTQSMYHAPHASIETSPSTNFTPRPNASSPHRLDPDNPPPPPSPTPIQPQVRVRRARGEQKDVDR